MTEKQLHIVLNSGRLSKQQIIEIVEKLVMQPELTYPLLLEVLEQDKKDSFNASWVFDHLMRKKLEFLLPHYETFINGLAELKSESIIRPMAHVCELSMEKYFKKKGSRFREHISDELLERIMTINFDWLIGDYKVATKAFAMSSLFYLGTNYDWIHPELKIILEQNIHGATPGYRSKASKILAALKKLGF
ncbi:hypothetical protein KIM67_15650 [Flagellimonas sp. 389]|uniref:hypothetical protein n=1 Tax=Flagellimonas sp. 389 TaxID=2835862 RepID=UPI001BD37A53|nr:hypothetical protein [Flagellimonas sp. 389]MBS9463855.1 hypothetical protein [Flagellimonas sp. 389]